MELQKLIDGLRAHRNGAASYESVDEAIRVLEAMRDIDSQKVCKGLECCVLRDPDDHQRCGECPYNSHAISNEPCANGLKFNALALIRQQQERIKELEAVSDKNVGEWTTQRTNEHDGEWYCSNCGYEPVVMSDDMQYCPGCGAKMKMPEPPKEEEHGTD